MKTVCIIPARWGSTRFPGKPLAPIRGATGIERSLILRTLKQAVKAECFDNIYVATDDERIADALTGWVEVIMTSPDNMNGTERCAEAAVRLDLDGMDIVVNLQGDSVLTPPAWLSAVVDAMKQSPGTPVTTLVYPRGHHEPPAPGDVEAIINKDFWSLYFTRGPLPPSDEGRYQHFGIYGYRAGILRCYPLWKPTPREVAESLEQLRFLERGIQIRCIAPLVPGGVFPEREVNYPNDIAAVEEVLRKWNIE